MRIPTKLITTAVASGVPTERSLSFQLLGGSRGCVWGSPFAAGATYSLHLDAPAAAKCDKAPPLFRSCQRMRRGGALCEDALLTLAQDF